MLRSPAVSGRFYSAQKSELQADIAKYLVPSNRVRALGIVSPHAGYMFSGRIAGETFSRIEIPETVIVLGPNHYGVGEPLAVWEGEGWLTPLGTMLVDNLRCQRLRELCADLAVDILAHGQEHSLEVQVPFIQTLKPEAKLLPIAIGSAPLSALIGLGKALATLIRESAQPPLIVASSDMTHFESAEDASMKDHLALEHVLNLDPEGLFSTVRGHRISMCGVLPVMVMLYAARELNATRATLVDYGNSGETTGDYQDVVGYAGVIVE